MTLVFDLDGTLLNVKPKYYAAYCAFLARCDAEPLQIETFWEMKRAGISYQEILQAGKLAGCDGARLSLFIKEIIETESFLRLDEPFDDSKGVLDALSRKHQCCLVSMRRNEMTFQRQIGWLGIGQYFTKVLSACSFEDQSNRLTAKALALKSGQIGSPLLMIGDSRMDMLTGKQLRARTCAVSTGLCNHERLESYEPDFVIDSLSALPSVVAAL